MDRSKPQMNPGLAGPKGALDLPQAKANKGKVKRDNQSQRNWAQLPKRRTRTSK
jgi:hypothetical protein